MRARAFNPQIFLELLCCCVFAGLMLYLAVSGKYLSYVTPRMEPYLYFAAAVMVIWALAGLGRLFRPQYKLRAAHCLVLVVPILLLLLPHTPLSTSNLSGNYLGGNPFSARSGNAAQKQASSAKADLEAPSSIASDPSDAPSSEDEYAVDLAGLDTANRKITVSNDEFGEWLAEIYTNIENLKGYTVVITGFVYKDSEELKADEFVPARLAMTCCVADLAPIGLLCKYDKASELKAESWVTVEGTLFVGQSEYDGVKYDEPQLTVTKITPAQKAEGYIYPY